MGAWPVEAADGNPAAAQVHATEALQIATSVGMEVWRQRAQRQLAALEGEADNDPLAGTLTFVFTDIEGSTSQAGAGWWPATAVGW